MKNYKKVKALGAAGLAALMLTIGAAGMTANASAVLPNPDTCPHSWTVEEKSVTTSTTTHKTNDERICTITYTDTYRNVRCRVCGKILSSELESRIPSHSISHP